MATAALIELCGGKAALARSRRLRFGPVRDACRALRRQGIDNPLLQVPMIRQGNQVFALVEGTLVVPESGQLVLDEVVNQVSSHLSGEISVDPDLAAAIAAERASIAASPTVRGSRLAKIDLEPGGDSSALPSGMHQ